MHYVYLFVAIVAEVIATSALKYTNQFTQWLPSTIVVVGYGVSFYFLTLSLQSIPIGIAYALWSAIGIILISVMGWLLFDEVLDNAALVGIALIVLGVAVIRLFSDSAP